MAGTTKRKWWFPLDMAVTRINHAVLYVRDADVSASFYVDALGFDIASRFEFPSGGAGVFLRAAGSPNDHDLALFGVGQVEASTAGRGQVGMYHLAWEVTTLAELIDTGQRLQEMGSLVGQSNHGVSKSLYAQDPDGLEFEVLWAVPPELLDERDAITTAPLDFRAELERFGAETPARRTAHPATI